MTDPIVYNGLNQSQVNDIWREIVKGQGIGRGERTTECFNTSINGVVEAINNESKKDCQYYVKYCILPVVAGFGASYFFTSAHVKGMMIATALIIAIAALHLRRECRNELNDRLMALGMRT